MGKLDGSCVCGNVTYTCDADPIATVNCHCRDCQKSSGAAFSTNVIVPADSLQIRGDTLGVFQTSGADHGQATKRHFCRNCGSPTITISDAYPGFVFIKAGSLNDSSPAQPALDIWSETKQAWADHGQRPSAPRDPTSEATAQLAG
jgi:hypothetical protein